MKKTQSDNCTPDIFSNNKDETIKKDILPVNNTLITFGKYEGKPIETLATDIPYCQWLLSQSWFKGNAMASWESPFPDVWYFSFVKEEEN